MVVGQQFVLIDHLIYHPQIPTSFFDNLETDND